MVAGGQRGAAGTVVFCGAALAPVGQRDWVQILTFPNDAGGTNARLEFRYISDTGVVSVIGSYDNTGFTVNQDLHFDPPPGTIGWFHGIQQFQLPAAGGPLPSGEAFPYVSLAAGPRRPVAGA